MRRRATRATAGAAPAYAPERNRVERVWRPLKDELRNHRWWAGLPALERATGVQLHRRRAECHRPGRGIRRVEAVCTSG